MFNLTSKKYVFFGISALIILPGLLALIFWGLNLGIDFTGGATIDLRFAASPSAVHTQDVASVFRAAGAKDLNVVASTDLSGGTPASQYVYIRFSRPIGPGEVNSVLARLQDSASKLPALVTDQVNNKPVVHTLYTVTLPDKTKTTYGMMVVLFQKPVKAKDVQTALKDLPATDAAPVTAAPTATPAASATATAKAGTTPTPAPTATPTPSNQTFPVSVTDVQLGQNNQTYTVETQSDTTESGTKGALDLNAIVATLQQKYGYAYVQSSDQVGPSVAFETTLWAIAAVAAASAAILLYIGFAFRKVGSFRQALRYGACAVIALLHDAFVVLGLWAILGHFFDFKVDTLFVTAVLTVIGFSVHDTIVVFDRIRENLSRRSTETFDQVVNASLVQTMSRSLNTSLTVLITLSALTLIGGASIRTFTLALLIGIASGTYSSIFNASMLLDLWENREWRRWRWFRGKKQTQSPPSTTQRSRSLAGASSR